MVMMIHISLLYVKQSRRLLLQSSSSSSLSFPFQWSQYPSCCLARCCLFTTFNTNRKRTLTTTSNSLQGTVGNRGGGGYIDEWYASIIKSPEFYEKHSQLVVGTRSDSNSKSSSTNKQQRYRCYFYTVDLQGRLFLEETMPKNVTSCIKDIKFLNFFFYRLRPLRPEEQKMLLEAGIPVQDYPFVSPCRARDDDGGSSSSPAIEFNLVRPAATPIVFHSLIQQQQQSEEDHQHVARKKKTTIIDEEGVVDNNNYNEDNDDDDDDDDRYVLVYAGDKMQPFDWTRLAISSVTGKLYHPILASTAAKTRIKQKDDKNSSLSPSDENKQQDQQQHQQQQQEYALIRSSVAVKLSDRIVAVDTINNSYTNDGEESENSSSGMAIILKNKKMNHHHQQQQRNGSNSSNLFDDEQVEYQLQQHSELLLHSIPWLPLEAEPGPWAMPYNNDTYE